MTNNTYGVGTEEVLTSVLVNGLEARVYRLKLFNKINRHLPATYCTVMARLPVEDVKLGKTATVQIEFKDSDFVTYTVEVEEIGEDFVYDGAVTYYFTGRLI